MALMDDLDQRLGAIAASQDRYRPEAYLFVMATLVKAVERLARPRHLTGAELLEALRKTAADQFGPMAETVLRHWGIKKSLDFGHIVFTLVEQGLLSKTESDSLRDFEDSVFFEKLFDTSAGYRLNL